MELVILCLCVVAAKVITSKLMTSHMVAKPNPYHRPIKQGKQSRSEFDANQWLAKAGK